MISTYNRNLTEFAVEPRSRISRADARIWIELLRNRKMLGYQFLINRTVLNFMTDFFCKELNLVIEIDEETHDFKKVDDMIRDEILISYGYTTLRFSEKEVMENIEEVDAVLREWIGRRKQN